MGLSNAISQDATHPRKGAVTVLHPVSCIFSADATHPRKGTKNRRKRIAPFSAAFFFCSADYLKLLSSTQRGTGALLCMKKPAPVRRGRGRRLSFPCRWSRTGPCRRPRSGWTGRPPWSRNRSSCPPFRSMDRGLSRPPLFLFCNKKGMPGRVLNRVFQNNLSSDGRWKGRSAQPLFCAVLPTPLTPQRAKNRRKRKIPFFLRLFL